jgi:magnesium-transporting ATPase (P-type)
MSVIVRNPEGRILVMCKGADSIILPLLHRESQNVEKTVKMLEGFSKEGLRTLLIAEKEISEDVYNTWNAKYQ